MGPLVKGLNDQMAQLGVDQKAVAIAYHDEHTKQAGSDGALSFDTVVAKLSRLLEGKFEGIEFFWGDSKRLEVLAETLKTDTDSLEQLREAQDGFHVLVLDPKLPLAPRRYLKKHQDENQDRFEVVEPEGSSREDLRDAALDLPGALVVLSEGEDKSFFEAVNVATTDIFWDRRGYSLAAAPDLVPLPPAPAPKMSDDDGMPMVPHEEYWKATSETVDEKEQKRVETVETQGTTPTFRVDRVLKWLATEGPAAGRFEHLQRLSATVSREIFLRRPEDDRTFVWVHNNNIFRVGPDQAEALASITEHHPIDRPKSFPKVRELIDTWNPWRQLDEQREPRWDGKWAEAKDLVHDECGVDITNTFDVWVRRAEAKAEVKPLVYLDDPALEVVAREELVELTLRPMALPRDKAFLIFVLRAVAEAPLAVMPSEDHDLFHVLASLGSGKLLWVRAIHFPGEEPRELRFVDRKAYWQESPDGARIDGGDVHLWLLPDHSSWLEGVTLLSGVGLDDDAFDYLDDELEGDELERTDD